MTTDETAPTRAGRRARVDATIGLGPGTPAEIALRVVLARRDDLRILGESFTVEELERGDAEWGSAPPVDPPAAGTGDLPAGGPRPLAVEPDADGSVVTLIRTTGAPLRIRYGADVALLDGPPPPPLSLADRLEFTTQSRYCPSDLTGGLAGSLFGPVHGSEAIEAVVSWVREHITYQFFSSQGGTTAIDTLASAAGVCRDFAHLTVCLLRSLGVPARYVAVYAPDLEQQDFHAVVEAHDGQRWRLVDATGLTDPAQALRIAAGRDGADTPFLSVLSGYAPLEVVRVDAHLQ